jgi:hypothetical protein
MAKKTTVKERNDEVLRRLPERLNALIDERETTKPELATNSGHAYDTVAKLTREGARPPNLETLSDFATTLGVDISELLSPEKEG